MKLLVDVGNTAVKWRLKGGKEIRSGGLMHDRDWAGIVDGMVGQLTDAADNILVASVAGREGDQLLALALEQELGCRPAFYYSQIEDCGVRNAYTQPERLGVDRWLATIEAWNRYGAAIVVDCGTAITLDLVDAAGQHHGGYIAPGIGLMKKSLFQGTADLHVQAIEQQSLAPGITTTEGVERGVLLMAAAFVSQAVVELQKAVSDTCRILMTGGDARLLLPFLPISVERVPDLVLDGLDRVAEMTDKK